MWSFSALVYISTLSRLSSNKFLMKLSLSNRSLYATNRFWIWNAASFPSIYTSSLVPFAKRIYSKFWSSNTLKNWYPFTTWLSAGESINAIASAMQFCASSNVFAATLPSASITQKSTLDIAFNPSTVVCKIWFDIIPNFLSFDFS